MGCVDDEDVVCAGVLDQIALIVRGAGSPIAPERADLLGNGQVARAVKSKDLVGPVACADGELR